MTQSTTPRLTSWQAEVLDELARIDPLARARYERAGQLRHYQDLAQHLESALGDEVLSRAAFLHGAPTEHLRRMPSRLIGIDVLDVLLERDRLKALDADNPEVGDRLLAEVLPSLRNPRSIVLTVREQLHHLDPDGALERWWGRFRKNTSLPVPGLSDRYITASGQAVTASGQGLESLTRFARQVIAPTARFFGLWQERNTIEDAALLWDDPARFQRLVDFARNHSTVGGQCELMCSIVRRILDPAPIRGVRVDWQMRHIASLDLELATQSPEAWPKYLFRTGFVTVRCPSIEACYQALYYLHSAPETCLSYRPGDLRDTLGLPTPAGYRALHTALVPPIGSGVTSEVISVRLVPEGSDELRFDRCCPERVEIITRQLDHGEQLRLRVFTPEGRPVELAAGSTVLDFAVHINRRWVAYLAGATVNRQSVDVLHRLKPGDVVFLEVSETPRPLPEGWQLRVTTSTGTIMKHFRKYYATELERLGEVWLRRQITDLGVENLPDTELLLILLEKAVTDLKHFHDTVKGAWVMHQLGLHVARLRGWDLPFRYSLDASLPERIITATAAALRDARLETIQELDIPAHLRSSIDKLVICPICRPSMRTEMVGILQDRVITIHSATTGHIADEPEDRVVPVSRTWLSPPTHCIVVEVEDRVGAAVDVLSVFRELEISVLDVAATSLAAGWAVVRVQLRHVHPARIEQAIARLDRMEGTGRIVGPGKEDVPVLEEALPPRRESGGQAWRHTAPYFVGSEITDDAYFYGLDTERRKLQGAFERACELEDGGVSVFVHGPKRVGKTSLTRVFLRDLQQQPTRPCVSAYLEIPSLMTWHEIENELCRRLLRQLAYVPGAATLKMAVDGPLRLARLVQEITSQLDYVVVLALDEAVGLLEAAFQRGESAQIEAFRTMVGGIPRTMVVWIGPEAPALRLEWGKDLLTQRAEQIRVGTLSVNEVGALLRAEKLRPKHHIVVTDTLARTVHSWTAGNPYWVSQLGLHMWDLARPRKDGQVPYDHNLLRRAREALFDAGVSFADRLRTRAGSSVGWSIMRILARRRTSLTRPGMSVRALRSALMAAARADRKKDPADDTATSTREAIPSLSELADELAEMRARGTVVSRGVGSQALWQISSPILARYIEHCRWTEPGRGRRDGHHVTMNTTSP